MAYIKVTENGSGRISFSNKTNLVKGLSVEGLTTCTAIVIIGDQGMAVIHDEGHSSIEHIKKEFKFVGNVTEWAIFYNSEKLQDDGLISRKKDMEDLIGNYNETLKRAADGTCFREAPQGRLAINSANRSISEVDIDSEVPANDPKDYPRRNAIRNLNNLCSFVARKKREVPVDVQFDGDKEMDLPELLFDSAYAYQAIKSLAMGDKRFEREYMDYHSLAYRAPSPEKNRKDQFDDLEKIYEETHDQQLLPNLIQLAKKANQYLGRQAANGDNYEAYETAEHYLDKAKEYHVELERLCTASSDQFDELEKLYKNTRNEQLLPSLIQLAKKIAQYCRQSAESSEDSDECHDNAENYSDKAKNYSVDQFDNLEKLYEETHDQQLLPNLIELAKQAAQCHAMSGEGDECSNAAAVYLEKAENYRVELEKLSSVSVDQNKDAVKSAKKKPKKGINK